MNAQLDDKGRRIALMRAALRESTGDPRIDELAQASILASIADDPELVAVYKEETAPLQAQLDLHLTGGDVVGHAAKAKPLGDFMRHAAASVNEIAKSISHVSRLGDRLIVEPGPGSVRLIMRAPLANGDQEDDSSRQPAASIESQAIDLLANLFKEAETDAVEDSPLKAMVQGLSPRARTRIRQLAGTARRQNWTIDGEVTRRGSAPRRVELTQRGAARLEDETKLGGPDPAKEVVLYGELDGQFRSESLMGFIPEGARKFKASITDSDLMNKVAHLSAEEGLRVRAVFDLYEVVPPGMSDAVQRSYTLKAVEPAPRAETRPLF